MNADVLQTSADQARHAMLDLEHVLQQISDADLHRAEPDGGWTVAQVVSHIHICGLLWLADLERLKNHPEQHMFMYREELGHDVVGAPPPSISDATGRIGSVRTAMEQCLPKTDPAVLAKSLEVPTLGTMTIDAWMPLIIGHLAMHVGQVKNILRSRNVSFTSTNDTPATGPDL